MLGALFLTFHSSHVVGQHSMNVFNHRLLLSKSYSTLLNKATGWFQSVKKFKTIQFSVTAVEHNNGHLISVGYIRHRIYNNEAIFGVWFIYLLTPLLFVSLLVFRFINCYSFFFYFVYFSKFSCKN